MEMFRHSIEIAAYGGEHTATVEMTVSAEFACFEVPEKIQHELEIEAVPKCSTALSDVDIDMGRTWVTVDRRKVLRMVVLSDVDLPSVFGVFARVQLDFIPDPTQGDQDSPAR